VAQLAGWDLALDGIEEAEEFEVAVALHAAADHPSTEHGERSKQGGRAMAFTVMYHICSARA
jgi:hypothetical protein